MLLYGNNKSQVYIWLIKKNTCIYFYQYSTIEVGGCGLDYLNLTNSGQAIVLHFKLGRHHILIAWLTETYICCLEKQMYCAAKILFIWLVKLTKKKVMQNVGKRGWLKPQTKYFRPGSIHLKWFVVKGFGDYCIIKTVNTCGKHWLGYISDNLI